MIPYQTKRERIRIFPTVWKIGTNVGDSQIIKLFNSGDRVVRWRFFVCFFTDKTGTGYKNIKDKNPLMTKKQA